MKAFRIYRLPGSKEFWHIDAGAQTPVFNVRGYQCNVDSFSIDDFNSHLRYGGPRAWIEVPQPCELHVINGVAVFTFPQAEIEMIRSGVIEAQNAAAELIRNEAPQFVKDAVLPEIDKKEQA